MLLVSILTALSSPAMAAECHTLREARTQWPNTYLRYATDGHKRGGAKCWFPGGAAARVISARLPMPRPNTELSPQQRIESAFWVFLIIEYSPPCWVNVVPRKIGLQQEAYVCRILIAY